MNDLWAQALTELADKYRALATMCAERDAFEAAGVSVLDGEAQRERHGRARALARRFPGALRELDGASLDGLHERLRAVEVEIAAGQPRHAAPRWMQVVVDFHAELRELLLIRAAIGRGDEVTDEARARVQSPPYGRLQELVWENLARRYALSREAVRAMVHGGES